jgi:hypothetical protein
MPGSTATSRSLNLMFSLSLGDDVGDIQHTMKSRLIVTMVIAALALTVFADDHVDDAIVARTRA